MVSQLKMLCRILVRHRFLLSAGLSAAAGIILRSTVLIPVADPLFRYAALQRPSIYLAFVWSFAIFLFTTPFLMLSMCLSLLYIHFYEEETAETLGTLPEYPEPQYRQDLFLILGELHHQLEATPAAYPQWLSIPEKGLYTGIAALGAVGSGKTRGVILPAMHQLFGYKAGDPEKKLSGIVLEVKGDLCSQVARIAAVPSVRMTFIPIFVGITRFDRELEQEDRAGYRCPPVAEDRGKCTAAKITRAAYASLYCNSAEPYEAHAPIPGDRKASAAHLAFCRALARS